jgi:prepilin-type N-terminal cleavage/methylation domain-containing protein
VRTRLAFTLIELLVVVAIIAVLAGLLLPAIVGSKESSRNAVCLNNLHQFAIATMSYTMDHNGNVPGFWTWLHKENLLTGQGGVTNGSLYPYLNSPGVYFCPTDKLALDTRPKTRATTAQHRDYSYAMNCGICHATDMASFLAPSQTLLYMEANLAANDFSGMADPGFGGPGIGASGLALRHHKLGHLVMADLHVATMNTNDFKQAAKTRRFWLPNNSTDTMGFFNGLQ